MNFIGDLSLNASAADLKRNQQGDYYVGDKTILNAQPGQSGMSFRFFA
jgi:hypothetical protein